jgi:predicted hydrocarbon binding protein
MTMQQQELTVTNLSVRAVYDTLAGIVGENARNIIFRAAGLSSVLKSVPEYDWNKKYTNKQQLDIYTEIIRLVGAVGSQGILRQVGYKNAEISTITFGVLNHLRDLASDEKFKKSLEMFSMAINRGKVVDNGEAKAAFDVPECLMCEGISSIKPYCAQYAGAMNFFADWAYGKGKYLVRETRCKALGEESCLFELKERS